MATLPEAIKPFITIGAEFNLSLLNGKPDLQGSCPFCFHTSKRSRVGAFYINQVTHNFCCHHCGAKGNGIRGLSTLIHSRAVKQGSPDKLKSLASRKPPLTAAMLKAERIVHDPILNWYIIPIYDRDGKIREFRYLSPDKPKVQTLYGGHQHLYRLNTLAPRGDIFLCEGEWDAILLAHIFKILKTKESVLGIPGTSFSPQWVSHFTGRNVFLLYDADDAGDQGMVSTTYKLNGVARSIYRITWPSTHEKMDIRDLANLVLKEANATSFTEPLAQQLFDQISGWLSESNSHSSGFFPHTTSKEEILRNLPRKPPTFKQLVSKFSECYSFPNVHETLSVILGTVLSTRLPGDPVWLFLVAPPGGGKTLYLRTLRESHFTHYESSLAPKSLVSGWRDDDGNDPSLLPKLNFKCLIIKDYTTVLSQHREAQEEIFSVLRDAYDGFVQRSYGNDARADYESHFHIIAGVTNRIHGAVHASLGERFLKYQLLDTDATHDDTTQVLAALDGMSRDHENEVYISALMQLFLDSQPYSVPEVPEWFKLQVIPLAQFIARLRAEASDAYQAGPEIATRLAKQLLKLAQGIAMVQGAKSLTRSHFPLIRKVAFNTAIGWQSSVMLLLLDHSSKHNHAQSWPGSTTLDIGTEINIPYKRLHQSLQDLTSLQLTSRTSVPGTSLHCYKPTPFMVDLYRKAR